MQNAEEEGIKRKENIAANNFRITIRRWPYSVLCRTLDMRRALQVTAVHVLMLFRYACFYLDLLGILLGITGG